VVADMTSAVAPAAAGSRELPVMTTFRCVLPRRRVRMVLQVLSATDGHGAVSMSVSGAFTLDVWGRCAPLNASPASTSAFVPARRAP
jgi:hypothetical protein